MAVRMTIVALLAALILAATVSGLPRGAVQTGSLSTQLTWAGFLYGIPALLALLVLARQRWALMACVMYATIGLALDISTAVQEGTGLVSKSETLMLSGLSGLVNFVMIVLAGWAFMHGESAGKPRAGPPPNPPHPLVSESDVPGRSRRP